MAARLLLVLFLTTAFVSGQNCGSQGCGAAGGCCSKYGYCGSTAEYCDKSQGCLSGCWGGGGDGSNGGSKDLIEQGDRAGNDLAFLTGVSSAEDCQKRCRDTDGCTAFSFDNCGKSNCWLKSSEGWLDRNVQCRSTGVISKGSSSGSSTGSSGNGGGGGGGGNGGKGQSACQKDNTFKITSVYENSTPDLQYCHCAWQNDKHGITAGFPGFTTRDGAALEMLTQYQGQYPNNNFTYLMGEVKNALHTNNDIRGYCDAWKKECKLDRFKKAEIAYVDKHYYDNSQSTADKFKITSPLVRALFYDTNIMQGDGGDWSNGQYDLTGIAKWTRSQRGDPDSSAASQLAWARAFNERRKWVFQTNPDGGWEGCIYRYNSWKYILDNNDASMPGRTVKLLENGGGPMTVTCDN